MLVGHGTRDDEGTRQFFQLGERLAETLSPTPVQSCLLEFQQPTIAEAWTALVQSGVKHVHVAPLLLFAAGHAKSDIPDAVRNAKLDSPGITFDQSRPLSRHAAIIDLVCRRIDETSRRNRVTTISHGADHGRTRESRSVCPSRHASFDRSRQPQAWVLTLRTRRFTRWRSRDLPEVIDAVASSGKYDSIIVQPHLLFAGRCTKRSKRK